MALTTCSCGCSFLFVTDVVFFLLLRCFSHTILTESWIRTAIITWISDCSLTSNVSVIQTVSASLCFQHFLHRPSVVLSERLLILQDIAIKLIKRMKGLFASHGIYFDSKEIVLELNGCSIEAYPSNHLDA